jgi:hypothetical protein
VRGSLLLFPASGTDAIDVYSDGADKPNKKYADPRVWVREGELTSPFFFSSFPSSLITDTHTSHSQ